MMRVYIPARVGHAVPSRRGGGGAGSRLDRYSKHAGNLFLYQCLTELLLYIYYASNGGTISFFASLP